MAAAGSGRGEAAIDHLAVALGVERWLASRALRHALAALSEAGVTARAAMAIEWLPALEVGWVNGLCDAERRRLLMLVDESAVGGDVRTQIAQWCHTAPEPAVSTAGRVVLTHRLAALPPAAAAATLDRLLDACHAVADAAGGFGLWRVSAKERRVGEAIRRELAASPGSPPFADEGVAPDEFLFVRVLAEYREMPGLSLTASQAARLWRVPPEVSEQILHSLVDLGRLRRTADGRYCAPGDLEVSWRRPRAPR